MKNTFKTIIYKIILTGLLLFQGISLYALSPDFYASSSILSEGRWAKIEISETGMQLINIALLRNLGFTDPSKVNVYGFGGRMLSENLNEDMEDDLPLIPSIVTNQGIVFFGHASTGWAASTNGNSVYSHINNAYSDHAYYFISDRETTRPIAEDAILINSDSATPITIFTERLVHEQDLLAPSNTGRLILGEDFRVQKKRQFSFQLPGNTGDVKATVAFGAKTSAGTSSLTFTANGTQLTSSKTDQIASTSSSKFISTTTTVKTIENPGERLQFSIEFNNTGAITTAALDYIEIEYPRQLALVENELYFYLSPTQTSQVVLQGCNQSTLIWDITDPLNPKEIKGTLTGSTMTFNVAPGYGEFIAFNPSSVSNKATSAGLISNQDIHSQSAPGMVVICPNEYMEAARKIADIHSRYDGLDVLIVTPEQVYNEFSSGNPDVTAFRRMLKMWYDRAVLNNGEYTRYCLIMSRPTYDNKMNTALVKNAGYPRLPIWQSQSGETESNSYSTDDYVGMLDDNIAKAFNIATAKIHTAVGRMPVKSAAEANTAVAKLENYLFNPKLGSWRNNVMVIADDQDNGIHLQQAETTIDALRSAGNGSKFIYEKLYLDAYPLVYTATGASYPNVRERMFEKIAEGVAYIDYIGHANPSTWGHEGLLTWTDITSFDNTNLPFIYAATCEFMRWDADEVSGAEVLWLNPNAGVIGMICPSRSVLISANGSLNKSTSAFVFQRDSDGKPLRVGDIMVKGKNNGPSDSNKLRYGLIGDPAMRLPSPEYSVEVEKINGVNVMDGEVYPELKACSTANVSGIVTDINGNLCEDFNGVLEIQLYDAEKVITTYGNGDNGVESMYNDRKTRLFKGRVNVVDGRWKATITMPSEIENNYSPALFSMYAFDANGREANGACEQFYVYGFDDNAVADTEGPVISDFYLNHEAFADGDLVSPSPILSAKVSDISGINLSDAGIGHSMIISIDGKHFYNDVSMYYTPDLDDACGGNITYALSNIEPGEHTLTLTVWDNLNNSSSASLTFNVAASWLPQINTLTTDVNPATTSVNFIVSTDGNDGNTSCMIEVFDLGGKLVWSSSRDSSANTRKTFGWNLCDSAGARVNRGIYLYRAIITTSAGATITKTKKLAVAAG